MRPLSSTPLDIRGMGEAAYSLPLWQQYEMRDLIAPAIDDRDSLAYWSDTGRTYAVDELRRRRTRAGQLALIEGAGAQLVARDLTTWTDAAGRVTDLGDDTFRIVKTAGGTFSIRDVYPIGNPHALRFQARLISGAVISDDYIGLVNSSTPVSTVAVSSLTSEWQDYDAVSLSDTDRAVILGRASSEWTIEIRRVQVEQNPYPTSWIPGPGTARAADDVQTSVITQSKGLLLLPFRRPYALTGSEQFRLYEASGGTSDLLVNVSSAGTISTQIEGVGVGSTPAITVTDWNIYGYAWDNGAARVFLNGTKEVSASASDPIGSVFALLYGGPFSANRYLNGVGGAFLCEGCAFTDAQIAAISDDLLARLPA
jgi:hypothetical protein